MFRLAKNLALVIVASISLCRCATAANNPTPYIYEPLIPTTTVPGGAGFTLTVNGTGFVAGAVVSWNGSARKTTFVSGSQVTAAITAADVASPGTVLITVTNPPPGGGTSNSEYFQITVPTTSLAFNDTILSTSNAIKVVMGDFNGDGKPDLVVLESAPNTPGAAYVIQILLGNGDGTFQAPTTVFTIPYDFVVSDLAVGDLNGDGKLDLVGTFQVFSQGFATGTFTFLGNGDGTFQPPVESANDHTSGTLSTNTVIADVNGDGIPDLVLACRRGVYVELGNGDGTFSLGFTYTPPPLFYFPADSVVVGDFHKSGKLDIVANFNYNGNYFLIMLPGNGDGTFGSSSVIYEGQTQLFSKGLESLVAVDLYNDGNLDLAFYYTMPNPPQPSSQPLGAVSSMRGNGDGTFQSPQTIGGLPQTYMPSPLILGDFNGDGHTDLAAKNAVVLLGNAAGSASYSVTTESSPSSAYAAADLNGDGRLDLVGIDSTQNVHVLLQAVDFVGSIAPSDQRIEAGDTATYTITVTSLVNGFGGAIKLSASQLPPGATATFSPSTLTGPGTATVTVTTASNTPNGSYQVLFSGSSGGITHTGGVLLNVGTSGTNFADFGGTVSPPYQTVAWGQTGSYTISIFPANGFHADVNLSVSGLPPGATATFSPSAITNGSGQSVLTISVAAPTTEGFYSLTITATGGGITHTNGMYLDVVPGATALIDFGGSVSPAFQTVQPGGSTTFNVSIFPLSEFNFSNVNLSISGLPPGATATFTPSVIARENGTSTLTVTTASSTPTGTYHLLIRATSDYQSHTNGMTLNVGPAGTDFTDYTGSITPQSRTEPAGGNVSFTLAIQPFNGTGCVTLQASGLPQGTTGAFSPSNKVCGSPATVTFNISISSQTATGTYTLLFQGTTTGGYVRSGTVTLTITPGSSAMP